MANNNVKKVPFGLMPDGTRVDKYILSAGDYTVALTALGAAIVDVSLPDKNGVRRHVVAGFATPEESLRAGGCYGAIIGRVTNRVKDASFVLDGKTYHLEQNEGKNCLHSGESNYAVRLWSAKVINGEQPGVCFSLVSPDGDGGFPGNLLVSATYTLSGSGDLSLRMTAETDKTTVVNLTNHAYFNLGGVGSGTVLDHELTLRADSVTETDEKLIPTGNCLSVNGTPYDFRISKTIGEGLDHADAQLKLLGGFDHNFVLTPGDGVHEAAVVRSPKTGIAMRLSTNQPCVQFYTVYSKRNGITYAGGVVPDLLDTFCLEAQAMPDAVHHPEICDITLHPGDLYDKTIVFSFSEGC